MDGFGFSDDEGVIALSASQDQVYGMDLDKLPAEGGQRQGGKQTVMADAKFCNTFENIFDESDMSLNK